MSSILSEVPLMSPPPEIPVFCRAFTQNSPHADSLENLYALENTKNRPNLTIQTVYGGANGGNRTHDLLITSELLYP